MRFAYADPPYIGQAKKHYSYDPNHAEVDHEQLVGDLMVYDAWLLSLTSNSLKQVLAYCPEGVRVAAWVKPFCSFKKGVNPAYTWEPVVFFGSRNQRGESEITTRDFVSVMPPIFQRKHESKVPGEKPKAFCFWLFELIGALPEDEFTDLFPGSGVVTRSWEEHQRSLFNMQSTKRPIYKQMSGLAPERR